MKQLSAFDVVQSAVVLWYASSEWWSMKSLRARAGPILTSLRASRKIKVIFQVVYCNTTIYRFYTIMVLW